MSVSSLPTIVRTDSVTSPRSADIDRQSVFSFIQDENNALSLDTEEESDDILALIRRSVSGKDAVFNGPFGKKKVTYCDYTASGKPLDFLENFIRDYVYPFYANTHTSSNITGKQTSAFRHDARDILKKCVRGTNEDVVIFVGSGATAAIHKLINVIGLKGARVKSTVVITGPYEHHSNILPWKETGAEFVRITEDNKGLVDMEMLEKKLKHYHAESYNIIVAMSAASNVTGIMTDTEAVAELTHKYGGLSFWDYAAGGPYVKIDMNPSPVAYKDAVYLSPHKFVGGVGTPGVLFAKKKLFTNPVPHNCGGGTVLLVTQENHVYLDDIQEREEGGTPAIVESIRAGLAFTLKKVIGESVIEEIEETFCRRAFDHWKNNPNVYVLGSQRARRVPIFSLLYYNPPSGKMLHHNFTSTLLNDLYGIQVRGGCACAGPYAIDLLKITRENVHALQHFLGNRKDCASPTCHLEKHGPMQIIKFGFSRLNLPYFFDEKTIDYVLRAVDTVATHGWKLLPLYTYNPDTADWSHRKKGEVKVHSLQNITITTDGVSVNNPSDVFLRKVGTMSMERTERDAMNIFKKARDLCKHVRFDKDPDMHMSEEERRGLWFLLPEEAHALLMVPEKALKHIPLEESDMPVSVRKYDEEANEAALANSQLTPRFAASGSPPTGRKSPVEKKKFGTQLVPGGGMHHHMSRSTTDLRSTGTSNEEMPTGVTGHKVGYRERLTSGPDNSQGLGSNLKSTKFLSSSMHDLFRSQKARKELKKGKSKKGICVIS